MKAVATKLQIAESLASLCEAKPLGKISVSDIIERTGKNRKTFYYHFEDKDALIVWKYRYDLGQELEDLEQEPGVTLVYESDQDASKDLAAYPFYLTNPVDASTLDQTQFFEAVARVVKRQPHFYGQALLETGPGSLRTYLFALYRPMFEQDIRYMLANRYFPQEGVDCLADFFTTGFVYNLVSHFEQPMLVWSHPDCSQFGNLIHMSMKSLLDNTQLRRRID